MVLGRHESKIFIMRTRWDVINDFITGKYFHKRLYKYYRQRPVRFVDFLANPSDQTYFFKESSFYVCCLLLVISLFYKVYIFLHEMLICYFTSRPSARFFTLRGHKFFKKSQLQGLLKQLSLE